MMNTRSEEAFLKTPPKHASIKELVAKTRSFRRFHESEPVTMEVLYELIDLARLAGSARNVQPLKYLPVNTPKINNRIFPTLTWAGYLMDWPGPPAGERPAAYIVCLLDTTFSASADCDLGIATQNILLGAAEKGLGGCRIASIAPGLREVLGLPEHLKILLVIALGRPKEEVVIDDLGPGRDIRYWRDEQQVHHVPKRALDEIVIRPA